MINPVRSGRKLTQLLLKLTQLLVRIFLLNLYSPVYSRKSTGSLFLFSEEFFKCTNSVTEQLNQLFLMIVIGYPLLLFCKSLQLFLNSHKKACRISGITGSSSCLYCICLFDNLLDQKILDNFSRCSEVSLEVSSYMTLCTVDTSYQLPLALIESVVRDKSLVLTLPVEHLNDNVLIGSRKIQKVILETLICDSLLTLNERKIDDIVLIVIPVENTVIEILYLRSSLLFTAVCSLLGNALDHNLIGILSAACLLCSKACCHVTQTLSDITFIQLPLDERMNTCIIISSEKLLYRLLIIKR